jgi:putative oxidoreductase
LQRLFSNFANGWPGSGLLILRLLIACTAFRLALTPAGHAPLLVSAPRLVQAGTGILLLVGLWTPAVGALLAAIEVWLVLSQAGDTSTRVVLATLAVALAMIGPGAWSIDARLFGRRVMKAPDGKLRESRRT